MPRVSYGHSSDAWANVVSKIESLILSHGFRRIVEIGGGANPTFTLDFVAAHELEYTLLDISQVELDKAPAGYAKLQADICSDIPLGSNAYDFAFSRMLAEHVPDASRFHRNVHGLLREGGMAFHFFPTLYAPPFLVNYLMPERAAESLLHLLQPGRDRTGKTGKFPAYYGWCRGPLRSQFRRFEDVGFRVEEYWGFFGHEPYYRRIPFLHRAHLALAQTLQRNPVPALTSFAQVLLCKDTKVAPHRHALKPG